MRGRVFRIALAVVAVASLATGVAASSQGPEAPRPEVSLPTQANASTAHPGTPRDLVAPTRRPNIVFVLTDDLSMNLLRYMPHVRRCSARADVQQLLRRRLAVLSVALVDLHRPLPARHRGVHERGPDGGFREFHDRGEELHTFAVALQQRRLPHGDDGQVPQRLRPAGSDPGPVTTSRPAGPSGTSPAAAIRSSTTASTKTAAAISTAASPEDYLTDVLARQGVDFINSSARPGSRSSSSSRRSRRTRPTRRRRAMPTTSPG